MTRDERTAVLVIRAWREDGPDESRVLARLTRTTNADEPGREESVAAGEEAILDAVAAWLHAFSGR